ncbi:MAG: amidohydrolase family protein, partial [Candidatus Limnocylindria bacterium]
MRTPRPDLVVSGQVVVAARPDGLETAEAVGIADGRVVAVGPRHEVAEAAAPGARVIDAERAAVVPGVHDFHLHLVGMARARRTVRLEDAADFADVLGRAAAAARELEPDAWLTGRGWSEATLDHAALDRLEAAVGERPCFLTSHDGHSAWASAAARRLGRIGPGSSDPAGGRIERDVHGAPTGVLRETAMEPVATAADRLRGEMLWAAVDETLRDLAALGITGASEAGDYTDENGVGPYAAMGDSFSSLAEHAERIDGRLRLTLGIPADALAAAAELGLQTGAPFAGTTTLRFGWAKEYADGALGSRTAALFAPYSCGDDADAGILRVPSDELDGLFAAARPARIGVAVHAIGDRANAAVLDAVERSAPRAAGVPLDRLEHA